MGILHDTHVELGDNAWVCMHLRSVGKEGLTSVSTASIGLIDGGTAGLIWMYFICWIGFICVNTSMAEMGSMAPTSGGQYHWVSEFAPPQSQRFLSYLIGKLSISP